MINRKLKTVSIIFIVVMAVALTLPGCKSSTPDPVPAPAGGSSASGSSAEADSPAEATSYPEKNITILVPYSPGGSYDMYARLLGPFLQKYLPGNPNVIVENVEGGGGVTGMNKLYNAEPDGYTLGVMNIPGFTVNQIMGTAGYKLEDFSYIGIMSFSTYVGAVSPLSSYRSMEDLINSEEAVKVGSVGLSSAAGLGTLLMTDVVGMNAELVPNTGASESAMSAIRGDTQYIQESYAAMAQYLEAEQLIPVVVFSEERLDAYPDVPTIAELGYPELLDTVMQCRPLAAPPGVPEDVLAIIKTAFESAMNDPEFQSTALEVMKEEVDMVNGDDTKTLTLNALEQFAQYKDIIAENSN